MGTNYYVQLPACPNACEHCGKRDWVHLGKSSVGWSFSFRAYREPEAGSGIPVVNDFESWKALASMGPIEAEYRMESSLEELLEMIESKKNGRNHALEYPDDRHFVVDGHSFTDTEFF